MQEAQRGLVDLGFARRVASTFDIVLVTNRGEHHAALRPVVGASDYDDGRRGVGGDLQANRTEHEVLEPSETAIAHHDSATQADGPAKDGDGCAAAELRGDVQTGILFRDGFGGLPQQFVARSADALDVLSREVENPAVRVGRVDDAQCAATA